MNSIYLRNVLHRMPAPPRHSFSSFYSGNSTQGGRSQHIRSYPQYTVYGEHCVLGLKLLPPLFRVLKSNSLVLDNNKKGRILFEWTARSSDGTIDRDRQLRFGLSPEEIGLLLDQLPDHQVEFTRTPPPADQYNASYSSSPSQRAPEKVLSITPMNAGVVSFKVSYESVDGSHSGGFGDNNYSGNISKHVASGPLEVLVQLGEFQVMREIMRSSIPLLVGWTTMVEVAMQRTLDDALRNQESAPSGLSSHDVPF